MNEPFNELAPCAEIRALLPRRMDADGDAASAACVDAHLAACPACRREAAALHGIGSLLRETGPAAALPSGAQVARRIVELERARSPWARMADFRRVRWALAGAAAACVLVIGMYRPATHAEVPAAPPEPAQFLSVSDDERTGRRVVQAPGPQAPLQ